MKSKLTGNLTFIVETAFILIIFGLITFIVIHNPSPFVITLNFILTVLIFIYVTYRSRQRINLIVQRMTNELASLSEDLSDKDYSHINDETSLFYEELTRSKRLLRKHDHIRQELLDIVNSVAMNIEFGKLLRELMPKLNEATRSNCSAFYTVNHSTNKLEIQHSIGFSKNIYSEFDLSMGEGFIGQAVANNNTTVLHDVPEDTVYLVRTFLGKIKPRNLMVVPITVQDQLNGVLVCASIHEYTHEDREIVELIKHYLGVAVANGINYEKTKRLNSELTFQNRLIQDQHEDMIKRLNEKTHLLTFFINYIGDDCLYAIDTRGIILLWNKGAERLHRISSDEAVNRSVERVYDEQQWPFMDTQIKSALKDGEHHECFWREAPTGDRHYYEMNLICMYNENNEPIGLLNHIKEISPENSPS